MLKILLIIPSRSSQKITHYSYLEAYFKITDIVIIKVVVVLPKWLYTFAGLNVNPQSNIFHIYGYNLGNLFCCLQCFMPI